MARPKRQTVDYFPHQCRHGKTMFILEQRYGNDGYAFWFKVLEQLGASEGHFIDCRNPVTWEFLQSITRMSAEKCDDILNLLAKLDAIDPELWSIRVIWSGNFLKGISDVYKNRRVEIPSRPSFYIQKPHQDDISTVENPQSKVKESKVKESKKEEYSFVEEKSSPKPTRSKLTDEEFISALKNNPAYSHIDIDRELAKMDAWLLTPKGSKRQKTRQFIVNWLNKIDRPLEGGNGTYSRRDNGGDGTPPKPAGKYAHLTITAPDEDSEGLRSDGDTSERRDTEALPEREEV